MSTVKVCEPHSGLPLEEIKSRLQAFEQDVAKYGLKMSWSGDRADLKGTGASGDIQVDAGMVTVTIKLGMVAKVAGIKPDLLERSIRKRLQAALR